MAFSQYDAIARQKAIDNGKTTYVRPSDGERYTIRNLDNPRHKNRYDGQGGRDELSSSRKANRGGGSDGSRVINEKLATPDGVDRKAFGKAMDDANAKGMDGDHIQEVSRTADGIRFKETSGRGTRQQYHKNMADAGVPVGNQAANVQPLPPKVNQQVKPAQLRAMDQAIKGAKGVFKGRGFPGGVRINGILPFLDYISMGDEITGGHIDKAIKSGVDKTKNEMAYIFNSAVQEGQVYGIPLIL